MLADHAMCRTLFEARRRFWAGQMNNGIWEQKLNYETIDTALVDFIRYWWNQVAEFEDFCKTL